MIEWMFGTTEFDEITVTQWHRDVVKALKYNFCSNHGTTSGFYQTNRQSKRTLTLSIFFLSKINAKFQNILSSFTIHIICTPKKGHCNVCDKDLLNEVGVWLKLFLDNENHKVDGEKEELRLRGKRHPLLQQNCYCLVSFFVFGRRERKKVHAM